MEKHKKLIHTLASLTAAVMILTDIFGNGSVLMVRAEGTMTESGENQEIENTFQEELETVAEESPEGEKTENSDTWETLPEIKETQAKSESVEKETQNSQEPESPSMEPEESESKTETETETGTESETETEMETESEEESEVTLSQEIGNLKVEAVYAKGVLPEGTELSVTEVSGKSYDNQLKGKAQEQGRVLTARKYYDVTFLLDGEEQEPEGGEVNVRFYYSQSVTADSLSQKEIEAQAEKLDNPARTEKTADSKVEVDGNVLKVDGEKVLAVVDGDMVTDGLEEMLEMDTDSQKKDVGEKVTVADDARISLYHFTGDSPKEVSADIQTTGTNQIKEVNFTSGSFSVYAVTVTNSTESGDTVTVDETSADGLSSEQLVAFINTQFANGKSVALGQNIEIPVGSYLTIPDEKTITLYLNGWSITPQASDTARENAAIKVGANASFTVKDKVGGTGVTSGTGTGTISGFSKKSVIEITGENAAIQLREGSFKNNIAGVIYTPGFSDHVGPAKITLAGSNFIGNSGYWGSVVFGKQLNLVIENGTFQGNGKNESNKAQDGGVICVNGLRSTGHQSTITIKGGTFEKNAAKDKGGVICGADSTVIEISGGTFESNTAARGGAIYLECNEGKGEDGNLVISDGVFENNRAEGPGNDVADTWNNYGGAILAAAEKITLSGGDIKNNWTAGGGGGIRINRGSFTMSGGCVTGNTAGSNEGGGIALYNCTAVITKGTITGNKTGFLENGDPNPDYQHWGGGGIFCDSQSKLIIKNAKITENKAHGFGGGIAGCATGRVFVFEKDGCALYRNQDFKALNPTAPVLSGSLSTKHYDRVFAATNQVFLDNGSADYYCALNSSVSWKMNSGGGQTVAAGWKGSVDGTAVTNTQTSGVLEANYLMGLTANPDGEIGADGQFSVIIRDNESRTHGGGILNNGYLIVGTTTEITTGSRIELGATKAMVCGDQQSALTDAEFTFTLTEVDASGNPVADGFTSTGTNDINGGISFDKLIPLNKEKNGNDAYYFKLTENKNGADSTITYSQAEYLIKVTTKKEQLSSLTLMQESGTNVSIENYQIRIQNITVTDKDRNAVEVTYTPEGDDKATKVSIGKGEKGLATFVNEKAAPEPEPEPEPVQEQITIQVHKNWTDPSWAKKEYGGVIHPDVTFVLYRYGADKGKREERGSLTLHNGEVDGSFPKQDKYYDVEKRLAYTYAVEELPVNGYRNTAVGQDAAGTLWTFTNERIADTTTSLVVYKVASNDNTRRLAGAEFDLYLVNGADRSHIGHGITGEDGRLTFKGLAPGTYQLVETKAPEGYARSGNIYEIVLTEEQISQAGMAAELAGRENGEIGCLITNKPGSADDDPEDGDVVPLEGDVLGVELARQKVLESDAKGNRRNIPQTGDDTPVAGLALLAAFSIGIMGFYTWKRKKKCKNP